MSDQAWQGPRHQSRHLQGDTHLDKCNLALALAYFIRQRLFHTIFEQRIKKLGQLPVQLAKLRDVREAVGFIPDLRKIDHALPLYDVVVDTYRVAFMAVFLALAGMGVVGLVFSFLIEELSLENDETGRQAFEEEPKNS